jgi:hypothetical protein
MELPTSPTSRSSYSAPQPQRQSEATLPAGRTVAILAPTNAPSTSFGPTRSEPGNASTNSSANTYPSSRLVPARPTESTGGTVRANGNPDTICTELLTELFPGTWGGAVWNASTIFELKVVDSFPPFLTSAEYV